MILKVLLPQINLDDTKKQLLFTAEDKEAAKKCRKDSSLMESCDDYLVSGKRNYRNLYNFVIKTVTECTVFVKMILKVKRLNEKGHSLMLPSHPSVSSKKRMKQVHNIISVETNSRPGGPSCAKDGYHYPLDKSLSTK